MVPKFHEFLYPALKYLQDGATRTNREIYQHLSKQFSLSEDDLSKQISSGSSQAESNMGWALTFLYQAGLTTKAKRGYHKISQLGLDLLANKSITSISEKFLVDNYGEGKVFFHPELKVNSKQNKSVDCSAETEAPETNPIEIIDSAMSQINEALKTELLAMVHGMSPQSFESLVVALLAKMGYGGGRRDAAMVTRYSGDEGIDGIIKDDYLGLETIYLQAKRWQTGNNVGRKDIQAFMGAILGKNSNKGVFITTSDFTKEARDWAKNTSNANIILINGDTLANLMIENNLGVSTKQTYEIKRLDYDFFDE